MKKLLILISFLFTPFLVVADEHSNLNNNSYYFGATIGFTEIDTGVSNVSGAVLDESDYGGTIFIGKHINNNVAIEGFYTDFGQATLSGVSGNTFTYNSVDYQFTGTGTLFLTGQSVGANIKLSTDKDKAISSYLKAGIQSWQIEAGEITSTGISSIAVDGVDPIVGVGMEYRLDDWAVILGVDRYQLDDDHVNVLLTGFSFNF